MLSHAWDVIQYGIQNKIQFDDRLKINLFFFFFFLNLSTLLSIDLKRVRNHITDINYYSNFETQGTIFNTLIHCSISQTLFRSQYQDVLNASATIKVDFYAVYQYLLCHQNLTDNWHT